MWDGNMPDGPNRLFFRFFFSFVSIVIFFKFIIFACGDLGRQKWMFWSFFKNQQGRTSRYASRALQICKEGVNIESFYIISNQCNTFKSRDVITVTGWSFFFL